MNGTKGFAGRLAVAGLAVLVAAGRAGALIDPDFTPNHIMRQSEAVLVLEFTGLDANSGIAVAAVKKALKADPNKPAPPRELKLDLLAMGDQLSAQGKAIMALIAGGEKQAVFFTPRGTFSNSRGDSLDPVEEGVVVAYLQFTNKWVVLNRNKTDRGLWDMQEIRARLNGTWAGSTDMFLRCLERIAVEADYPVPVTAGVEWDAGGITRFGKMGGKVFAALPVDTGGKGRADLFLAGDAGDRLFRWDGKGLADVTAKVGLATKSLVAAWGDFDGDARLDLASWDGKTLSVCLQKADGAFAAAKDAGAGLKEDCFSLSTLDAGTGAKAGLLVATKTWPVLLVPKDGGTFEARPLGTGDYPGKDLGTPGPCMVADLDNDGFVDVLQVLSDGALFFKGKAPGTFAAAVRTPLGAGSGKFGLCLGDFDGDGLQDLFIAGDARNRLYQNLGGGKFLDMLGFSGSVEYISKNGGILAWSGDFNNDSTQDLLMAYGTPMAPHLFFNRGFRCFGQARELDLADQRAALEPLDPGLVPEALASQQTACLGDFNGDGALDMILVLLGQADMPKAEGQAIAAGAAVYWDPANKVVTTKGSGTPLGKAEAAADANDTSVSIRVEGGNLIFFPRRVTAEGGAPGVTVSLPPGGPTPGPVSVSAWVGDRNLGAWILRAGDPAAVIGTHRGGVAVTLKVLLPDGKTMEKKVKVRDEPLKVILGKD